VRAYIIVIADVYGPVSYYIMHKVPLYITRSCCCSKLSAAAFFLLLFQSNVKLSALSTFYYVRVV